MKPCIIQGARERVLGLEWLDVYFFRGCHGEEQAKGRATREVDVMGQVA